MTPPPGTPPSGPPTELPESVRVRVVALAAEALGRMDAEQLPPSLKRVASFAPARRARLAAAQIAGAVAQDDDFRERLAAQVRDEVSELAAALDAGAAVPAVDPVELAAVAYLLRPTGWADLVSAAAEVVDAERVVAGHRQSAEQVDRLTLQLEQATEQLKDSRRRHREQLAELKEEIADLRRKLGDARARVRSAESSAEAAAARVQDVEGAAAARSTDQEAELRRLRARTEQLERDLASSRRAERGDRLSETMRARLLLDTMLETAQGLRRELALPAVEGSPADAVEAHVAEQGSRPSSGQGSLPSDDPALLDHLLALPRAHLVVDGYNVTKTAWPDLSLERQRDRLVGGLAPLAARSRAEVTVVFDAGGTTERPLVNRPRGVRVLYSPPGVIADDVIRELVAAEPRGRPVVVASSDVELTRDVRRAGARTVAATALSRLLARA